MDKYFYLVTRYWTTTYNTNFDVLSEDSSPGSLLQIETNEQLNIVYGGMGSKQDGYSSRVPLSSTD